MKFKPLVLGLAVASLVLGAPAAAAGAATPMHVVAKQTAVGAYAVAMAAGNATRPARMELVLTAKPRRAGRGQLGPGVYGEQRRCRLDHEAAQGRCANGDRTQAAGAVGELHRLGQRSAGRLGLADGGDRGLTACPGNW